MTFSESKLDDLLDQWENYWQDGQYVSATELCSECPEYVGELRKRITDLLNFERFTAPGDSSRNAIPDRIGKYQVVSQISRGGMGIVYLCSQQTPNRNVAVKVLRAEKLTTHALARFEREIDVLGMQTHSGIAKIFDAGIADLGLGPQPFIVMEFVDGLPINEFADRDKLDYRERVRLIIDTADAIDHANKKGVIHRDVKPSNILIDPEGKSKILDFGISKITQEQMSRQHVTASFDLVGTLPYMSPEQVSKKSNEIDIRSDVYSLGVVTFELLTGKLPLELRCLPAFEAVRMVRDEECPSLGTMDKKLAGDIELIVAKALAKSPDERYANIGLFAEDLERYLNHQSISIRPVGEIGRVSSWSRRHPKSALSYLIVSLLLATLTVYLILYSMKKYGSNGDRTNGEWSYQTAKDHESDRIARSSSQFDNELARRMPSGSLAIREILYEFPNPNPKTISEFGHAVCANNTFLVVGVPFDHKLGKNAGSVWIYEQTSGNSQKPVLNPAAGDGRLFGWSVDIDNEVGDGKLIVGAPGSDSATAGKAYLFDSRSGQLLQTYESPKSHAGDEFGCSVGISNGRILIGARSQNVGGTKSGAAYVFDADNANSIATLTIPNLGSEDGFGHSVAIFNGSASQSIVVAAPFADNEFQDDGSVFVYTIDGHFIRQLVDPNSETGKNFGYSVDVDRHYVVTGVPQASEFGAFAGEAIIYDLNGIVHQRIKNPNPGSHSGFGRSVAVHGIHTLVSAPSNMSDRGNSNGAAYLFAATDGSLVGTFSDSSSSGGQFGFAVGLTSRNSLMGVPGADDRKGRVVSMKVPITIRVTRFINKRQYVVLDGYGPIVKKATITLTDKAGKKATYELKPDQLSWGYIEIGMDDIVGVNPLGNGCITVTAEIIDQDGVVRNPPSTTYWRRP